MASILLIDDDVGTLLTYRCILRTAGHDVVTAALGEEGVNTARRDQFDAVLCDQRLLDVPGTSVIREIRESCRRTAIVLVTAWATPELIVEAKRAGATSYAAKPLIGDELLSVVDEALRLQAAGDATRSIPAEYASRRWADLVVRGVHLLDDPKTIPLWCHGIAVAHGTLKKRCNAVHVTAKDSLALVRLLRVVRDHQGEGWGLQQWLDILDDRTAHALLERAGFSAEWPTVPDPEAFLSHQRLVSSAELVNALRSRLSQIVRH